MRSVSDLNPARPVKLTPSLIMSLTYIHKTIVRKTRKAIIERSLSVTKTKCTPTIYQFLRNWNKYCI